MSNLRQDVQTTIATNSLTVTLPTLGVGEGDRRITNILISGTTGDGVAEAMVVTIGGQAISLPAFAIAVPLPYAEFLPLVVRNGQACTVVASADDLDTGVLVVVSELVV